MKIVDIDNNISTRCLQTACYVMNRGRHIRFFSWLFALSVSKFTIYLTLITFIMILYYAITLRENLQYLRTKNIYKSNDPFALLVDRNNMSR